MSAAHPGLRVDRPDELLVGGGWEDLGHVATGGVEKIEVRTFRWYSRSS
jgi:hypothetical protein